MTTAAPATSGQREHRVDVRASWAGLTPRGGSFLSAGAVALACALLLRQVDLVRIALLLLALPLVLVVHMALISLHVTVRRDASPRRGSVGAPVTVTIALENRGGRRTPTLLMEDQVPDSLAVTARVVAPPLPAQATARVSYTVLPRHRGRFLLGPARVFVTEPFGMVERSWRAAGTDELIVRPAVVALDPLLRSTSRSGDSETAHAGVSSAGEVDMTVREYSQGDDLRRVHWPSTARRGALMVRRDERPQELRVLVVLDRRRVGHTGTGGGPGAVLESLEWAVSAAASVAATGAGTRHPVTLVGVDSAGQATDVDEALDRLALLEAGNETCLMTALGEVGSTQASAIVAILGDVGEHEVQALLIAGHEATRVAMCLRISTFAPAVGSEGAGGSWAPSRRRAADERHAASITALRTAGWSAVSVSAGDDLAQQWSLATMGT